MISNLGIDTDGVHGLAFVPLKCGSIAPKLPNRTTKLGLGNLDLIFSISRGVYKDFLHA